MTNTPEIAEHVRRGFTALGRRQFAEVASHCRAALALDRTCVPAHFLVGLAAMETNDRATALRAFGSVTRLAPRHAAAWSLLARLFVRAGQPNRADRALAEAAAHVGDEPLVMDTIGTVYTQLGDQSAARDWYTRALALQPGNPGIQVNLANSLVFLGEMAAAQQVLEGTLAAHPGNAQAHWLLAGCRRATDRRHVEALVKEIARGNRTGHEFAFLYYALGKELEDLEEWERAFEAFARGAKARRATLDFDEAAEAAAFEAAERLYTPDWLATRPPGAGDPAPIFVVGLPRTGTTLVERIITSHSRVTSAGELQQFALSLRRVIDAEVPGRFSAELYERAAGLDLRAVGEAYLQVTRRFRGEGGRFVDKLPSNYRYIPLILAALPNARIVHLVRDPVDACFASFKQLFADAYPHSYDLGEMARHYVRYHRLMAVWRERFPGRFLDVAYESVAADLEPNARRLIDYLGLPWEDACLQFHEQSGAVSTASAVQVREAPHTRSVGRWRRYERQLEPLLAELARAGIVTG
ncbi:MAG: sulfotransferase [Pseudomonadales bacterium]